MRATWIAATAATLFALSTEAAAQACPPSVSVNSYQVRPIVNAYADIDGMAGTVAALAAPFDDQATAAPIAFPAGFTFSYFGTARTQFSINANGYLWFNGANVSLATYGGRNDHVGGNNAPFDPNDAIYVWWEDLVGTGICGTSAVLYRHDAAAGTLTIEWKNVEMHVGVGAGEGTCFSFQAVLYASTHATKANYVEMHYDAASSPPASMMPCLTSSGINNGYHAVSATIGLEKDQFQTSGLSPNATVGVDGTERGAGNPGFPSSSLQYLPKTFSMPNSTDANWHTVSFVPVAPFQHIEGLPGTIEPIATGGGGPFCRGGMICYDDDNSAHNTGMLEPLPWKFTLYDRPTANFAIDSNGFIGMGQGTFMNFVGNPIAPGNRVPNLIIFPRHDDLQGIPVSDQCAHPFSSFMYRVDGLPGARVVTVEWHDAHPFDATGGACSGAAEHCSFQLRLYEASAASVTVTTPGCPPGAAPTVVPGTGNDRIEFIWAGGADCNHAGALGGSGIENYTGNALSNAVALFNPGGGSIIDPCQHGTTRYYGTRTNGLAATCFPEIRGNGVPPVIGNADFGLSIVGATPGSIVHLMLHFPALPGLRTPVLPGGLPLGLGALTLWVPFPPALFLPLGVAAGTGACTGAFHAGLPIPNTAALVGAEIFAQYATIVVGGGGLGFEATEGAKITLGS